MIVGDAPFVGVPIAVIVHTVTLFRGTGINFVIAVVTVTVRGDIACRRGGPANNELSIVPEAVLVGIAIIRDAAFVDNAVAIIVDAVTAFRSSGMDAGPAVIRVVIAITGIAHVPGRLTGRRGGISRIAIGVAVAVQVAGDDVPVVDYWPFYDFSTTTRRIFYFYIKSIGGKCEGVGWRECIRVHIIRIGIGFKSPF